MGLLRISALVLAALALAHCGVPQASLQLAQQQAGLSTEGLSDEEVTAALRGQADAWAQMAALVQKREVGGILFVDAGFLDQVQKNAAAAGRLRALIDAGQDDPAQRRDLLAAFQALWADAQSYLGQ